MPRLAVLGTATLIALSCAALPACGQQDETRKIIADCSDPPSDMLDSCLERARVQQETDPSPEMDRLIAQLIQQQVEARNPPEQPPPPDDNGVSTDAPSAPPPSPDLSDGSADQTPAMTQQDVAPPDEQDNPADEGQDEATGPPTPLPGSGSSQVETSTMPPPGGDTQNPPPQTGGP